VSAAANAKPPKVDPAPAGALADYRMAEGSGLHVYDHAVGKFGMLELANLDWVVDGGRPALRFADNTTGRKAYPRAGVIDRSYLGTPGYRERQTVATAIAGHHGGGFEVKALTVATWIKPAEQMGQSSHGGKGDVVGLGGRRFIVRLIGQQAPYRLGAAVNVNDQFTAEPKLEANRCYHVALTAAPDNGKWRIRLFLDGKPVHEGVTQKTEAPLTMPPSLVLGAELFYLHDAYYRGLIGRTLVFDRALSEREVAELAK